MFAPLRLGYAVARNRFCWVVRMGRPACWDAAALLLRKCAGVVAILVLSLSVLEAQHGGGASDPSSSGARPGDALHDSSIPEVNPQMQQQMADRRNSDRQRQLTADTEKLFQLAQQLRDEVAKSNKDQLSVGVVRKSEEIEKLAKSVKEKMRGY